MRKFSLLSFVACLILLFTACRKDDIQIDSPIQEPLPPEVIIEAAITGVVSDRDGSPLENTSITLDGKTVTTDVNGYFLITGNAPKRSAKLVVEKDGYFTTYHAVVPHKQDTSVTRIQLIAKQLSGSFSTDQGGLITLSNGATISFAPNGFVDEQGSPYTGEVNIYGHPIDPTDPDLAAFMPGDLTAIDLEENFVGLKSYGMVNIELEDGSGNPLQISKTATIRVPVPTSLRGNAPAEIPLWHFDTNDGLWKEEGKATLENNLYVGEVSHFSFWNCDDPFPIVNLEGIVRMGEHSPRLKVRIIRTNGDVGCGYTSLNGSFSGQIPRDESLTIELLDECGNIIYTDQIGPFSSDADLGTIFLSLSDGYLFVSGNVEDCNNNPVSNGYAYISVTGSNGRYQFPTYSNGYFSGLITTCGATQVDAYGVDLDNLEYGTAANFNLSGNTNLGTLSACGNQFTEGMTIHYNNTTYFIDNCTVNTADPTTNVFTFQASDNQGNDNKTVYRITLLDWNADPNNPFWQYTYEHILFNSPDPIWGFNDGTVSMTQRGQTAGEYTIININGATLENTVTGETFNNAQVSITARVE